METNKISQPRVSFPKDSVVSQTIDRKFGRFEDHIDVHIYNQNNQLLTSISNFTDYTILGDNSLTDEISLDPVLILNNNGYSSGKYKLVINILRKKIFNTLLKLFVIKAISPSRKELRVLARDIPNEELKKASKQYIDEVSNSPFLRDFILNFGDNNIVSGVNLAFSEESSPNELLIKLSEPLPNKFSSLNFLIEEEIASPIIYETDLGNLEFLDNNLNLKGPNFKIDVRLNNSIPSGYKNYNEILEYSLTSSYQNLLNKLENREIPDIQYDFIRTPSGSNEGDPQETTYNFENFVHFGSALERLKNFKYKIELLEQYNTQLANLNAIGGNTSGSIYTINNKNSIKDKKTNILKALDGYERFLYYESGTLAWPKSTLQSPHTLYSVSSSQVATWLGDERDSFPNYGGQLLSASLFDKLNDHSLVRLVPNHITENPDNEFYLTFLHMIGHHYDQIWTHIKHITEVNDTHHKRGISKDLVYYSLKSLGLETFDQFENSNLIEYILGEGDSGSIYYNSPISQSLVTASNAGSIPKEDITKEIWKRLYHNAPYLLKTKGTERGLKALMSCYGVPSTILNVKEYGGSTKDKTTYKTFSYEKSGLALKGDSGTNGFFINTPWSSSITNNLLPSDNISQSAKTVEFRIKPHRSNENYLLFALTGSSGGPNSDQFLTLEPYTGNDISSSGDSTQYGRLKWHLGNSNTNRNHTTEYFPIYNGDFWNIFIGIDDLTRDKGFTSNTQVTNKLKFGAYQSNFLKNVNYVTASVSQSLKVNQISGVWGIFDSSRTNPLNDFAIFKRTLAGASNCFIGGMNNNTNFYHSHVDELRYSGSLQEVRYHFGELLSHETLTKHALEPFMYSGNTPSSSYENTVLRLPLGSNDQRDSGSFHPNVEIDYLGTNAPELLEDSGSDFFIPNASLQINDPLNYISSSGISPNFKFQFVTTTGQSSEQSLIDIRYFTNNNTSSYRMLVGNIYRFNYTVSSSNHDNCLAIFQRTNSDKPLNPFNGSNNQIILPTTVGDHSITFAAAEPFFIVKRVVTGIDITLTNLSLKEDSLVKNSMTTQIWEEVIETHHLPTPDTVGISMTSEKTRIDTGTVDDNWLSSTRKTETSTLDRQPLDYPDLGVFFSPTTEINEDILYTLGSFRLDDYIGSPLPSAQSSSVYEDLSDIKDIYFKKVKKRYNYWDYIKLIQYIDHTLFKMIEQWVPMKANLKTGLLIEPHYLERTKFKREVPVIDQGQSMLSNSYQTFECEMDPNNSFSLSGSSVITTNNLLQTTDSNGQKQEQGTNATINVKETYKLAGVSNFEGNATNGISSNRYYQLRRVN